MQRYLALLKVIEVGSFTKAAELLGYTQPALSQMIASLEKELSVKLLYRSRYGVRLTPEGEWLYPSIQSTVLHYEKMRQMADEIHGLDSGIVRIGTFSSVSCHWLPGIIRKFWQDHPNIQVVLLQGDYDSIPEWVRTGVVDFGFTNPFALKGMKATMLKFDEFRVILPADHPLTDRGFLTLPDLTDENFLLLEEGSYSEPLEAFRAAGLQPRIKLRVHDDYTILRMVEQGLGISMLTNLVLCGTNYRIKALPIDPPIVRATGIITADEHTLPLASKEFLRYLMADKDILP